MLAAMIATGMMLLMVVLIYFARNGAIVTNTKALNKLWGQAILAEYDVNLNKDYGLLAYKGNDAEVQSKLTLYAGHTLSNAKGIDWQVENVNISSYSLINLDMFKKQLVKAAKFQLADDVKGVVIPGVEHDKKEADQGEETISSGEYEVLPSGGADTGISFSKLRELAGNVRDIKNIQYMVKEGSDKFFTCRYALHKFGTYLEPRSDKDAYLRNEQEYLICGKTSDKKNRKAVRNRIIAFQEVINLAYLHQHPEKTAAIDGLVGTLIPPPMSAATREALIAAWAFAESVNDYRLLINGKKVPLMKTEATWATDVTTAVTGLMHGYIDNNAEEGNTYGDYLKYMVYLLDEETINFRMMDLIQLSMRQKHYPSFLIRDFNGGVSFTIDVSGKDVPYEKVY